MPFGRIGPAPQVSFGIGILGLDGEFYFMRFPPHHQLTAPPQGSRLGDPVFFNIGVVPGPVPAPPGFNFAVDIRPALFTELRHFPAQHVPIAAPRVLTYREQLDGLKEQIVDNEDKLRQKAFRYLQSHPTPAPEQTVCFMWKIDSEWNDPAKACTGGQPMSRGERMVLTPENPDKATTCAEEIILCGRQPAGWEFSLAYDMSNGWKPACKKGCKALLRRLQIVDLYYATQWAFRDANAAFLLKRRVEYESKFLGAHK